MKLQIVKSSHNLISGYQHIVLEKPDHLQLDFIIDNQCEIIFAPDIMDMFHINNTQALILALLKKLRKNGEIVIGGTDVRLFAKALTNGVLTPEQACDVASSIRSMSYLDSVTEILSKVPDMNIVSTQLEGLHFEVKAVRL